MYFKRIKIENYKSYFDTETIHLETGINIIIGKNNAGKTALLEVLSGKINGIPHKNIKQKPRSTTPIKDEGAYGAWLEVQIEKKEFFEISEDKGYEGSIFLYLDEDYFGAREYDESDKFIGFVDNIYEEFEEQEGSYLIDSIHISNEEIVKKFEDLIKNGIAIEFSIPLMDLYVGEYSKKPVQQDGNIPVVVFEKNLESIKLSDCQLLTRDYEILNLCIRELLENRIYKFDIHRTIFNSSSTEVSNRLLPNCSNLPSVLDGFQANPHLFGEYNRLITEIFPEIKTISIAKERENSVIKIWMPQSSKEHLTIPLSDCGTGVGQVMAMLYVVISSEYPQIIIIDEPNSFLHPSASRKLIEIFKKYNHHQYIISTHSPEIITSSNPENIILLKMDETGKTQIHKINKTSRQEMQEILNEIGVKLSDVYGYDKIIWVEGETEQECFPEIVEKLIGKLISNIHILKVRDTGSFDKKHIRAAFSNYRRLVEGDFLIPPALAFIFDREGRNERDIEDLKREGQGKIHFLDRRLYENYLIDSEAIAEVLRTLIEDEALKFKQEVIEIREDKIPEPSREGIEELIEKLKNDRKYWDKKAPTEEQLINWKANIHASKLLEDVFNELTNFKIPYRKTTHSGKITSWLIENKPEALDELKDLLLKSMSDMPKT